MLNSDNISLVIANDISHTDFKKSDGIGLRTMRARVESIGAEINSVVGEGLATTEIIKNI